MSLLALRRAYRPLKRLGLNVDGAVNASVRPLLFVLIVVALLFGWLALRANPGARALSRAAKECAARYAEARSMRDTVRVDGTYPTEYAQEFSPRAGPATCGQLRRDGSLP